MTAMYVRGNMFRWLTAGKTYRQYFITGAELSEFPANERTRLQEDADAESAPVLTAIEREGIDNAITYLCSLAGSEEDALVWLGADDYRSFPEIYLEELEFNDPYWTPKRKWTWRRSFVGVNSSGGLDADYMLDDGIWRRVVGYWRNGQEIVHQDYATGSGTTIRFGNGGIWIDTRGKVGV